MKYSLMILSSIAYLSSCALNLVKYGETIQGPNMVAEISALERGNGYELVTAVNIANKILRRVDDINWIPMNSEFRDINNDGKLELVVLGGSDSLSFEIGADSLYKSQ